MVRAKFRYFVVQINPHHKPDGPLCVSSLTLYNQIKDKIQRFWGDFGVASMIRFNVKYFNERTRLCIIQVSHGPHRFVSSVLPLMQTAGKELVRYRTLYTGATMKHCNQFIVRYQQEFINRMIGRFRTRAEQENFVREVQKVIES